MSGAVRAAGWVAHLVAGGTTPWAGWSGPGPVAADVLPYVPGAQQLELLRRVNAYAAGHGLTLPDGLARRVLTATAAGRGALDVPLPGAAERRWGQPPVDPSALPAAELLRVAATLLAEDLAATGDPDGETGDPDLRTTPWPRSVLLAGDPMAVAHAGSALAARGLRPGGRSPRVLVLADHLDTMLAHAWAIRCFGSGAGGWDEWVERWTGRAALPPRLDLVSSARASGRPRRFVRVVVGTDAAVRELARRTGVRAPAPSPPGGDAAELARRVESVLRILVPGPRAEHLMAVTFLQRVPRTGVPLPGLPAAGLEWAHARAAVLADAVRASGYPVVGDPGRLRPSTDVAGTRTADDDVLALAVRMLADPGWQHGPRRV